MNNRFHIDVRPLGGLTVGDMEWARILFLLNHYIEMYFPHIEAVLEEYDVQTPVQPPVVRKGDGADVSGS